MATADIVIPVLPEAARVLPGLRTAGPARLPRRSGVIVPRAVDEPAPLSFAQQRLWFMHQLEPDSPLYNIPLAFRMEGRLDCEALRRALGQIVARHEILRSRIEAPGGTPVQIVIPPGEFALQVRDLPGCDEPRLQQALETEARQPFDLGSDLLLRGTVFRIGTDEHVLLLTLHHIASDGWSWSVLLNELCTLYRDFRDGATPSLAPLGIQYADYSVWQREWLSAAETARQMDYWRKQLAGATDVVALPTDRARPAVQTYRGGWVSRPLPSELLQTIHELGRREGATLFVTLFSSFLVLLHRHTQQTDLVVGTPIAGRMQRQTEELIGFFINTLALRGNLSGDPTFRDLMGRVRESVLGAFSHQDLPFEQIVSELRPERSPGRPPLVQVMFVLQNAPAGEWQMPGLKVTSLPIHTGTSKFDLTLMIEERAEGPVMSVEFNSDLFDPATVEELMTQWRMLLEVLPAAVGRRLSEIPQMPSPNRDRTLGTWSGQKRDYPRDSSIPDLFEEQVKLTPNAVAVTFQKESVTYRELDRRANRLAAILRREGVGRDVFVGVCLERSIDLIVALIGILKAGGAYVSLDAAYPKDRLTLLLEDAEPPVILTTSALKMRLPATSSRHLLMERLNIAKEERESRKGREAEEPATRSIQPGDLAYVSFTSGSTGRPKGVCVTHRGVARLVKSADYVRLDANEVMLHLAPVAFDASTFEIWGALLNGARLVVYPPQTPTLTELGEVIAGERITTLWLTAGLFHQVVEDRIQALQGVRQLLAGGDVLSPQHVRRVLEKLPDCQLINGYGPTENTTFTCCHPVTPESVRRPSIPIGRPIPNTTVHVLDSRREPVAVGVPGELYTGGDGLARGYLKRPELTAEKFVENPFVPGEKLYRTGDMVRWLPDGNLEFLGRIDQQVKIRGYRIELDEIESVLGRHPGVRHSVVVAQPAENGDKQLAAFIVAQDASAVTEEVFRRHLCEKLPAYMVPGRFVLVPALPLDPNGKVDRRALAGLNTRSTAPVPMTPETPAAARDDIERGLVEIWESILGRSPVGITERFFEIGGHSLLALRMLARIEDRFGRKLPLATIFQAATIHELASIIRGESKSPPFSSLVEIRSGVTRRPLFLVHGVGGGMFWGYSNLARHLAGNRPVYAFKSRGLDGLEEFATIEQLASHYLSDLVAFQPRGPYYLGGYCFGGNVAFEMARQLRARGAEVGLLVLMNCSPANGHYGRGRPFSPIWLGKFAWNLGGLLVNFCRARPEQRRDYVRWKLRNWRRHLATARQGGAPRSEFDVDRMVDLSQYDLDQRRLWAAHVKALCDHRTGIYDGPAVLYRSRVHQRYCSFDSDYGWSEFIRDGLKVQVVPGAHESILEEPHVQTLARQLGACLDRVEAERGCLS